MRSELLVSAVLLGLLSAICGGGALAQSGAYPVKTIRVLVPFSAGGTTDVMGRLVAQRLSAAYGQQVLIENRTGAGGHIAAELVARAPADGYTLMVGSIGIHAAHASYTKLTYDPTKDLQPVILMAEVPLVMLVHPSLPPRNVKDFIVLARSKPGEINYGSAGFGSSTHMTGALFEMMANVKLAHIPFKGSGQAVVALGAGHVDFSMENLGPVLPMVQSNRVRLLAVASHARHPQEPNVPTFRQAGLPEVNLATWIFLMAPAATPEAVVTLLNRTINDILKMPDTREKLLQQGFVHTGGTVEEMTQRMKTEATLWGAVIKNANITVQ